MRRHLACSCALLCTLLAASSAPAEPSHRLSLLGGAGLWLHPESGGHGIALAAYDLRGLPLGSRFKAEFNTDTVRLRYDGITLLDGQLELGGQLSGELWLAGLLMDYYQQGRRLPGRGFDASYGELQAFAKLNQPEHHHLSLVLGLRRWFLAANDSTDPALTLPPDAWVFSPQLGYTYWRLHVDPAWDEWHRLFPRFTGFALGFDVRIDARSATRPWGARDALVFATPDLRNDPRTVGVLARQWLRLGVGLHRLLRLQVTQQAVLSSGVDDLNRVRVGGLNPYVVPVAGAPWAAFLSGRLLALEASLHSQVGLGKLLELGLILDGVLLDDLSRTGRSDGGFMGGVGLFVDARWRGFQLDLRAGWCPTLDDQDAAGQLGVFGALGWQWDIR